MLEVCEGAMNPCEETKGLDWESGRTCYPWNGEGKDPNRKVFLCRACAKEWHEHWDEMWDHARGG